MYGIQSTCTCIAVMHGGTVYMCMCFSKCLPHSNDNTQMANNYVVRFLSVFNYYNNALLLCLCLLQFPHLVKCLKSSVHSCVLGFFYNLDNSIIDYPFLCG